MIQAARVASLLAVALLIPACNLTFTNDDPSASGPTAPQNPFALQVPIDGATGVMTMNTQFAWAADPGATSYELQISLTSDFAQILFDLPSILIPSVFTQAGLTNSTTYYWRVYGTAGGTTRLAAGSPSRFTTIGPFFTPPAQFFLQSPTGGPISIIPAPGFVWTVSPGAASYSFQIDTTSFFSNPVVNLPNLHLNLVTCPVMLAPNTIYHWRVTANNVYGQALSSPPEAVFFTGP
jgi:hypothetical protein